MNEALSADCGGLALHDSGTDDQHSDPYGEDQRCHGSSDCCDLLQNFRSITIADSGQERELEDDLAMPDMFECKHLKKQKRILKAENLIRKSEL